MNMVHENLDDTGKRFGMWLFLYTEMLLFGGLFILYAVYLSKYSADFVEWGKELNVVLGTTNTVILLISSFFVAAAIRAIRNERYNLSISFLVIAIFIAIAFLINKYFEWGHHIHLGLYPGSEVMAEKSAGANIFFSLYYSITGLHGLHVIIGGTLLAVCVFMIKFGKISRTKFVFLENSGLYWHLVDLIWIFVFPLFYLIV